ncbi:MAG: fucose pyrophosphorylase domain-containing protein, partial [Planctomycetota bacterium]
MRVSGQGWDYLVVTASDSQQEAAYARQLGLRRELGLLGGVGDVLVVPDPGGRQVGSGGSTIHGLLEILSRELADSDALADPAAWGERLERLRILILHGGGDSRQLRAYGPCGKLFIPVPGQNDAALPTTLFDRQIARYLDLPALPGRTGQVLVAAGESLLVLDPARVRFAAKGVTGLACRADAAEAGDRGVYAPGEDGTVRQYLHASPAEELAEAGAVDSNGQCLLDAGLMSFAPDAALHLVRLVEPQVRDGKLAWSGAVAEEIDIRGLALDREIACALGTEAGAERLVASARSSGSAWPAELLGELYAALADVPFHVCPAPRSQCLRFDRPRRLVTGGRELLAADRGALRLTGAVQINNEISETGCVAGQDAWVEACRLRAPLTLGGRNVVVGVDVDQPTELPPGACLDLTPAAGEAGGNWFVCCYGVEDDLLTPAGEGATFCGRPILDWLKTIGADASHAWPDEPEETQQTLFRARLFPAVSEPEAYGDWLWMFEPSNASRSSRRAWRHARRYSLAEIAVLTDQEAFHSRRLTLRGRDIRRSLPRMFRPDSDFSARELAFVLRRSDDRADWIAALVAEARRRSADAADPADVSSFVAARLLHSLGQALLELSAAEACEQLREVVGDVPAALAEPERLWLTGWKLLPDADTTAADWAARLKASALEGVAQTILTGGPGPPRSTARSPRSA